MRQSWQCYAGGLLALLGCNSAERPGLALDAEGLDGLRSGRDSVVVTDPTKPVLTDGVPLHPDTQSPCGATAVALEFQRPDLYFVLDGSGSTDDSIPRGSNLVDRQGVSVSLHSRFDALIFAVERVLSEVGHRVNFGATIFPAEDTVCGPGEEIFPIRAGDVVSYAVGGTYGPVLSDLLFALHHHSPDGGTPVAATLTELLPRLANSQRSPYIFLLTDGAPNCNPEVPCNAEACVPNLEGTTLGSSIGTTISCESPVNCCSEDLLGPNSCLDEPGSAAAVRALADIGIQTYVIGIPGSNAYSDVLDSLAIAGGTARPSAPFYYKVADASELTATVSSLGKSIALSCTIELTELPPLPDLVNVFFDGQLVEYDPENGWNWQNDQRIELIGDSCELWQAGQVLQADIVAGCPSVIR